MPNVPGFQRPTLKVILDRMLADLNTSLPGAEARLRRAVLNVLARTMAGAAHLLYGFISFIAQNVLIDTARTEWLVRHASIWGIARNAATFAQGTVTIQVLVSGSQGSVAVPSNIVIPEGTVLQRADGALFLTDAEVTLLAGTATVGNPISATAAITAQVAGILGNSETGMPFTFASPPSPIALTVIADSPGISGGAEAETDDALRARVLLRVQEPPMGGTAQDYVAWALEVAGVTRVWVFAGELGAGTVVVRFVRDNDVGSIIPDANEVQDVQDHLDIERPVTAAVTVVAPISAPIDMTIAVAPDTQAIRDAIVTELEDMFLRDSSPGVTIRLSRISEAISIASGEFRHELTVPSADVTHTQAELPELGTITWGVLSP